MLLLLVVLLLISSCCLKGCRAPKLGRVTDLQPDEINKATRSFLLALMEAISSAMASSAGAPLRGGQQGLEDCRRRMDLINAARRLRGLPVRLG